MLKAGSSMRCWGSLFGSILAVLAALFVFGTFSGVFSLAALPAMAFAAHGLALAYRVIDHPDPLLTADAQGLHFSPMLSDTGLLEWSQIKALRHLTLGDKIDGRGWFDYVMIASPKPGAFSGQAKLSPASWLGVYLLPTRLLDGGAAAGRAFVAEVEQARRDKRFDHAMSRVKMADGAAPLTAPIAVRAEPPSASAPPMVASEPAAPFTTRPVRSPQPRVAERQSLGTTAVPSAKPRNTGVLLNGKPLEF